MMQKDIQNQKITVQVKSQKNRLRPFLLLTQVDGGKDTCHFEARVFSKSEKKKQSVSLLQKWNN